MTTLPETYAHLQRIASLYGSAYARAASGCGEVILTQGRAQFYPWHMHAEHWTVGFVRQGSVFLATKIESRQLRAGQHFSIAPYELHSLRLEAESSLLVVCFESGGLVTEQGRAFFSQGPFFLGEAERTCFTAADASENSIPLQGACLCMPETEELRCARSIRELARLMLEKPAEALCLEQMACHAGYSPWHFLRLFQKIMHMTPHAFQLLCRLRLLRAMLRKDTASAELAVSAGFVDQSHMHKLFKRHHGMTPGQFKKAAFTLEAL